MPPLSPLARSRAATSLVFFANGLGIGGWSSAIAPLKLAFGLTDLRLSLILLAFAIGAVSSMPISGALAPRWGGGGRVTGRAGLAYALAMGLPWLAAGPGGLALAAFAMGVSNGVMDVSMNAHASVVERLWGRPIMSSFHAAFSVGGFAGAGVAAGLLGLGLGATSLLAGIGALALALVALARLWLGEGERAPGASAPLGWPERGFVGLAAIAFLCFLVEGAIVDWSGVYLVSRGAPLASASAGFAAFSVTMVTGRLLGDRIVARWGRLPVVAAGAGLTALGLALSVAAPVFPAIVLGCALVGAGLANVVPALFSESAALASTPQRGIAAAASAGYTGMLMGPPFVGAVASAASLRLSLASLALIALLAAALALGRRTAPAR